MVDFREAFVGALVGQIAQEGAKETIKIVRAGLQPPSNTSVAHASEPQQGNSIIPLAVGIVILLLLLRKKNNKNGE